MKSTIIRVFATIAVTILFIGCAFIIVVYASGYKIDIQNRKINKTALINVDVDPSDSQVYLSDKLIGTGSQTIRSLSAQKYLLQVKKESYTTFSKDLDPQEEQAVIVSGVVLFLEKPLRSDLDKAFTKEDLVNLSDSDNLTAINGELRFKGELVTRLSSEIYSPSWFPNRQYISFTSSGNLYLIRTDGTNLIAIASKDSQSPAIFTKSGHYVIFENQNQIIQEKIR